MAKTSHVHQLSQVLQVKISFFSHLQFLSGNLALKSKDVKCYQEWLKNGVKIRTLLSFFNPKFNDKFIYICSSFLNKTAQLIHLTIDLSRLQFKLRKV